MKIAGLAGMALLVLVTLATSFPLVVGAQGRIEERNMEDHMSFTRELAEQGAKIDTLQKQHDAMAAVPEKLARVEERLDIMTRMVYAILGGVFMLLVKETLVALRSIRARKPASL